MWFVAKCDSEDEDTAILVQVSPDVKDEEHDQIAKNVKEEVFHRAGLRAVPQEVFVSIVYLQLLWMIILTLSWYSSL